MARRLTLRAALAALVATGGLALAADAAAQTISGYEPTRVDPGGDVTAIGSGFGRRSSGRRIGWGRGAPAAPLGSVRANRWGRNRIEVTLPGDLAAGRYWLAIVDGDGRVVGEPGPETLVVGAAGAPPGPVVFPHRLPEEQLEPRGHTARQIESALEEMQSPPRLEVTRFEHPPEVRTRYNFAVEFDVTLRGGLQPQREIWIKWEDIPKVHGSLIRYPTLARGETQSQRMLRGVSPETVEDGYYVGRIKIGFAGQPEAVYTRELRIRAVD